MVASSSAPVISTTLLATSRGEEAHWSSFRGEVLQLQQTLVESLLCNGGENNHGCFSSASATKPTEKKTQRGDNTLNSRRERSRAPFYGSRANYSTTDDDDPLLKENKLPLRQPQLSPLEQVNDGCADKILLDNYTTTSFQTHHHFELLGMEEVDKSICSINNKHNISSQRHSNKIPTNNSNNNNALSHASQNTSAISIATQELAEMKLKLALTESERDELEFELMQSNK